MKAIYKGPSDIYVIEGKRFIKNGEAGDITQEQVKFAKIEGHSFEVMQEPAKPAKFESKEDRK